MTNQRDPNVARNRMVRSGGSFGLPMFLIALLVAMGGYYAYRTYGPNHTPTTGVGQSNVPKSN